jgi:hypothetical protein
MPMVDACRAYDFGFFQSRIDILEFITDSASFHPE